MNNFDNCEIAIANVIVILLARIFYEVKVIHYRIG